MNVTAFKISPRFEIYWVDYNNIKDLFIYDITDNQNLKSRYTMKYYLEELWESNSQKLFKHFLKELNT